MLENASWIKSPSDTGDVCPEFYINIVKDKTIKQATLAISAVGMYIAYINGKRVGKELFTPYWTEYNSRIQYQVYDVTNMLTDNSELSVICAEGWAVGRIGYDNLNHSFFDNIALIFSLKIVYENGDSEEFVSNQNTQVRTSQILFSQIYDGEIIDKTALKQRIGYAISDNVITKLIPQEGEKVIEQDRLSAVKYIITPKGERVIDFGQNLSGYVEITIRGKRGAKVSLRHAEVLDKDGNFYTENLRAAKQQMQYVLSGEEEEVLKPQFSWQGFRYICLDEYPFDEVDLSKFEAVAIYSDIKRTGHFVCGNNKINQLYSNVIWGQKSNYLDIPTDCPQRDERMGWTADAQVFVRTAAINFDVEKFYKKWLKDLAITQGDNGEIYDFAPIVKLINEPLVCSAAWGDAAVICPWEIYRAYGNKEILEQQFESMRKWIEYMRCAGDEEYLWLGGTHYGDWLAKDGEGHFGGTSTDYIASAYFAYSTSLFVKAGNIIGRDMSDYKELHKNIVKAVKKRFTKDGVPIQKTQTTHVLALHFNLCDNQQKTVDELVKMIEDNDMRLTTGFVGTPYILHALSKNGRADIAYNLLFQEKSPSWLYSINKGATTIWEHWDGIKEDGSFWQADMNSFNHYARGSVYDWIFGVAAGIEVAEGGYKRIVIKPYPDKRMGFLEASIETRQGKILSGWSFENGGVKFKFEIPKEINAEIILPNGQRDKISGGRYLYEIEG